MASAIGSGLPLPEVYKQRQLQAEQAYQAALADLAKQQRGMFAQYGFQGNVDEGSGAVNASIDPNLQFGLVQQMLRGHSANRTQLKENTSGRGLGKTGLARQRQNLLKFLQQGDVAGLGQRFQQGVQGIFGQRGNARRNRDQEFNMAEQEAMNYAIANGLFNQAPQPSPNQPAAPFTPQAAQQQLAGAMSATLTPGDNALQFVTTPYHDPYPAEAPNTGSGAWGELVAYDPLDPGAGIKYNRRR